MLKESLTIHKKVRDKNISHTAQHFDQEYHMRRINRVLDLIEITEGLVLDAGCGEGRISKYLPQTLSYVGIDFDAILISSLWKGSQKSYRILGEVTHLPFRDQCFDLVINLEVIEHLTKELQPSLVSELYRILKKSGRIILSSPNFGTLIHKSAWMITPEHFHCVTFAELIKLLKKNGFKKIKRISFDIVARYPHKLIKQVPYFIRSLLAKILVFDKFLLITAKKDE